MKDMTAFHDVTVEQACRLIDLLKPCTNDYLFVYDILNDFYYISAHALQRFRIPTHAFHDVTANLEKFVLPEDMAVLKADLENLIASDQTEHNLVYRWISVDDRPVWINCRGNVVRRPDTVFMIGCINEIGDRQMADNVSGLLGESSLRRQLMEVGEQLPTGYFLRLGLDNFKGINEKLGSEYGDLVLRKTAECIMECILPGQKLYRMVADEFLILDLQGGQPDGARALYYSIRRSLDQFVAENHYEAFVTISGGILDCAQVQKSTWSEIMKYSEFALNEAKRHGKNRCYLFDFSDYESFMRKKKLTQALRQAVSGGFEGFEAHFQPVFHVDSGELYGAEALMRFRCESLGSISPVEFIPILEETGLIIPAGRWILHKALEFCRDMRRRIPEFRISVNISHEQVRKSDLIADVEAAVARYQVPYSALILELTESGLFDSDAYLLRLWSSFKEKGIMLALDDFGTGYSNFQYLNDLRPDIIKINRSFTAKASDNDYEFNLLQLLGRMVHHLQLKLCVEGIENEKELKKMWNLPPDYSQGFYFGKPCSRNRFIEQFIK